MVDERIISVSYIIEIINNLSFRNGPEQTFLPIFSYCFLFILLPRKLYGDNSTCYMRLNTLKNNQFKVIFIVLFERV